MHVVKQPFNRLRFGGWFQLEFAGTQYHAARGCGCRLANMVCQALACSHGSKIQVKRIHKTQLVQGERLELKLIALACLPHLESPSAGCERHRSVEEANRLARRQAYLHLGLALLEQTHAIFHSPFCFAKLRIKYNWRKGVSYVIENPQSSLLWQYRCLQDPGPC